MKDGFLLAIFLILAMLALIFWRDFDKWRQLAVEKFVRKVLNTAANIASVSYSPELLCRVYSQQLGVPEFLMGPCQSCGFSEPRLARHLQLLTLFGKDAQLCFGYATKSPKSTSMLWLEFSHWRAHWALYCLGDKPILVQREQAPFSRFSWLTFSDFQTIVSPCAQPVALRSAHGSYSELALTDGD